MKVDASIFKVSYTTKTGETLVRLIGRDSDGDRVDLLVSGTEPHFFVDKNEAETANRLKEANLIKRIEEGPPCIDGRAMLRLVCRFPYDVRKLRENFVFTGEADIDYSRRVRIDYRFSWIRIPKGAKKLHVSEIEILDKPPNIKPRVLYFDIETDDKLPFDENNWAANPITAISFYDDKKQKYGDIHVGSKIDEKDVADELIKSGVAISDPFVLHNVKNERELIAAWGDIIQRIQPDIVDAWNGIGEDRKSGFDMRYLAERSKKLLAGEEQEDIKFVHENFDEDESRNHGIFAWADSMVIHAKQELRTKDNSLDAVAREVLGIGKVDRLNTVADLQRTNPAKWIAYGIVDSYLLRGISEKKKLIPYFVRIAQLAGVELVDPIYNSRIVDAMLLQEARNNANNEPTVCLPSKGQSEEQISNARAAIVFDPIIDIHLGAICFDLDQTYPSIQRTLNISPETYRSKPIPGETFDTEWGSYLKHPRGLIPKALDRLVTMRKEVKDTAKSLPLGSDEKEDAEVVSKALKFLINSFTGVMVEHHWRLRNQNIFETVTGVARMQLLWNKSHLQSGPWVRSVIGGGTGTYGRVIHGHTDSTTFKLWKDEKPVVGFDERLDYANRLQQALNDSYSEFFTQFGCTSHQTYLDFEGMFSVFRTLPLATGTGGAKTRYFGIYDYKDGKDVRSLPVEKRLKIIGIEYKRFNVATITRDSEKKVIALVCDGRGGEVRAYYQSVKTKAYTGQMDNDLMVPCRLGFSRLEDYRRKGNTPQPFVRAMENMQQYLGMEVNQQRAYKWCWVDSIRVNDKIINCETIAVPYLFTFDDLKAEKIEINMNRSKQIYETLTRPLTHLHPTLTGEQKELEEDF